MSFPGVDASTDDHCPFLSNINDFIGDGQHWDLEAAQRAGQRRHGLV